MCPSNTGAKVSVSNRSSLPKEPRPRTPLGRGFPYELTKHSELIPADPSEEIAGTSDCPKAPRNRFGGAAWRAGGKHRGYERLLDPASISLPQGPSKTVSSLAGGDGSLSGIDAGSAWAGKGAPDLSSARWGLFANTRHIVSTAPKTKALRSGSGGAILLHSRHASFGSRLAMNSARASLR